MIACRPFLREVVFRVGAHADPKFLLNDAEDNRAKVNVCLEVHGGIGRSNLAADGVPMSFMS